MHVPNEFVDAVASRLNDYGNERDWQKMRAYEMAGIALEAVLPMVRERLDGQYVRDAAEIAVHKEKEGDGPGCGCSACIGISVVQAAWDAAFPEENS